MRPPLLPRSTKKFALFALALLAALPTVARAWNVEISSETIGQGYQLVGGDGNVITRRRLDQYLGLNVWNLGRTDANGVPIEKNQFYFASSMRMQFDLGDYPVDKIGAVATPELSSNQQFELLYAYFGAKDLFGFIDAKLGRQFDYNLFEFTSYDGLSVDVKTPYFVSAHVFGGLLVNGFLPIDSPIFRPDGTAPGGALSVHDQDAKPIVGVSLRSFGFRDLDASISYRRVFAPSSNVGCDDGSSGLPVDIRAVEACKNYNGSTSNDGTSEEKIGATLRYRFLDGKLVPWVGARYDLMNGVLDLAEAGVRVAINANQALQLEYLYSFPTFDGDSIFNLFARSQFDDVRLSYDLRAGRFRGYAHAFVRLFQDIDETDRVTGVPVTNPTGSLDGGGDLGARYDLSGGFLRGDLYAELGYGGTKIGADASTRFKVYKDIFALEGRLTFVHFADDLRPIDNADSFGVQVGARISFWRGMLIHLMAEDNISRLYTSQVRLYAIVDVAALVASGGFSAAVPRGIGPNMGQYGSSYGNGMGY